MALSPAEMDAAVIRGLATKTGRTLEQWHELLRASGPFAKPAAAVAWLKAEHALGHVTAQIIIRASAPDAAHAEAPLDRLFGRPGSLQRDLFEALASRLRAVLPEACMGVRKGYASFTLRLQFLVVMRMPREPSLIVGLSDHDSASEGLPGASGLGGSDRIRYRLQLTDHAGIERVVVHALAAAGKASKQEFRR